MGIRRKRMAAATAVMVAAGLVGAAPASADNGAGQEQRELQFEQASEAAFEDWQADIEAVFVIPPNVRKHAKPGSDGAIAYPDWAYRLYPGTVPVQPVPGWLVRHGKVVDGQLVFQTWALKRWPILHHAELASGGELGVKNRRLNVNFVFSRPGTEREFVVSNVHGFQTGDEQRADVVRVRHRPHLDDVEQLWFSQGPSWSWTSVTGAEAHLSRVSFVGEIGGPDGVDSWPERPLLERKRDWNGWFQGWIDHDDEPQNDPPGVVHGS